MAAVELVTLATEQPAYPLHKNTAIYLLRGVATFVLIINISALLLLYSRPILPPDLQAIALTFHDDVALSFGLVGLALWSLTQGYWRCCRILAIAIFLSNSLAIMLTFFHGPAWLMQLSHFCVAGTPVQLSTVPSAYVPFVLVSMAIWILPNVIQDEFYSLTENILGAIIIALGLITFLAKNHEILTLYGWGQVTYGSMTTALGLVVIGMGILATAWHRSLVTDSSFIRIVPLLIISLIVVITLYLWQALLLENSTHIRRLTTLQINSVKNEMLARMQAKIRGLERMSHRWTIRGGTPLDEWQEDALAHIRDEAGMTAIDWIDNDLVIRWVVPPQDILHLKNLNALFESRRGEALIRASILKRATMSHVVRLLEGKQGILIYVPLTVAKKQDGFFLAALDVEGMFKRLLNESIAPGYNMDIYDGEHLLFHRGEQAGLLKTKWAETTFVNLYGITWTIQLWPSVLTLDGEKTALPAVALVMGLVMAFLLGLSIRFAQLAQKRATALNQSNLELTREINSRERAEEAKQEIEKLLLQNQKLKAIGTLAGGIAHDFNNILFSIIGYVDLALSDVPADSITHRNLEKVMLVAKRAQHLVAQILSFSQKRRYELQAISIGKLLSNTLIMVQAALVPGIKIEIYNNCGNAGDDVEGNDTQLEQVFMNIIKNAADAMGDEGKLIIRINRLEADQPFIKLHPGLEPRTYITIEFQDNGSGMDEVTQERLFEPFYTTKEVSKGTGLGMSIAHGIIQDHKGVIRVESTLGVGTRFFLYLPAIIINKDRE